jgi:chromosome segregation ATPase
MSRVSELENERDQRLSQMEHEYRGRQNDVEAQKEEVKSQAQEKQSRGEDASAEVQKYHDYEKVQDRNFDNYAEAREKVWGDYQGKINEAEQQEENDNDYGY